MLKYEYTASLNMLTSRLLPGLNKGAERESKGNSGENEKEREREKALGG